jgi:hypothetical protein
LDAEVFENLCFPKAASRPNKSDFDLFENLPTLSENENFRIGTFVLWNQKTGKVFIKEIDNNGKIRIGKKLNVIFKQLNK